MPRQPSAPRPPRPRWVFPVVGMVVIFVTLVVVFVVAGIADFGNSVCNPTAEEMRVARQATRENGLIAFLAIACAPALCARHARMHQRAWWPWAAVAGAFVVLALITCATAQPQEFCVF